jgi:hypothetical protein
MHKTWRILPFLICSATFAQSGSPITKSDNSDWWSLTRRDEIESQAVSQVREPSKSTFQIVGLELNSDIVETAHNKLGKASVVQRGDASAGRTQVCYTSRGEPRVHLVFEKGEVNEALYLFNVGPDWKGSDLCSASDFVTETLSTKSGLHLGETLSEVRAILGKPSAATDRKLTYLFSVEKKTTTAEGGVYTLTVYIECGFTNRKLSYLAISKAESF